MHARTFVMFWSVTKSVLWIVAVTLPAFFLIPATASSVSGWSLTLAALAGGFAFGLGAGINGACAYSTMARFVDGEAGMLVTVAGFSLGVFAFSDLVAAGWIARPSPAPALVSSFAGWGVLLGAILLVCAVYEAYRLWRTRPAGKPLFDLVLTRRYRLSTAALIMGIAGGLIFLFYGAAGYTSTFEVVVEGALGTRPWPSAERWLLLVAVVAGMFLSALVRGGPRLDWRPRLAWLRNLAGGVLMGIGVALTPGGNDALVLYSLPSLSPHAIPSYLALALGVAVALVLMRVLFGIKMGAEVKDDVFLTDWGLGTRPQKS